MQEHIISIAIEDIESGWTPRTLTLRSLNANGSAFLVANLQPHLRTNRPITIRTTWGNGNEQRTRAATGLLTAFDSSSGEVTAILTLQGSFTENVVRPRNF